MTVQSVPVGYRCHDGQGQELGRSQPNDSSGYLWVEEGVPRKGVIAEVAPLIPVYRTYSFAVPQPMAETLDIGRRVWVPLRRRGRLVQGFVVALDSGTWDATLRPIDSLVDDTSFLGPDLIRLGREIAEHYACPLGQTLKSMTPESVRRERGLTTVRYVRLVRPAEEILGGDRRVGAKRRAIVEALAVASGLLPVNSLLKDVDASPAVLRRLVIDGWVEIIKRKEAGAVPEADHDLIEPGFEINQEQRRALDVINGKIDAGRFFVTLLFGVSGSGKTEVYIRAMRRVIETGGQAILLVPEIVLTTQLVGRLASRFANVAVNHSGLTDAQRSRIWRQIAAGEKDVVIGTRSAVFAPCRRLGLICVDEEQESSYKNLQAPRFLVRDVAIMRAKQLDIPVVLGSATPSMETWYNSEHRRDYQRIVINHRVRALPLPKVHLVDMRDEQAELKTPVIISRTFERLLGETLERREQALILINRRGYAQRMYCPACKSRVICPNCNVGLVVHAARGESICHYCHRRTPTPEVCAVVSCGQRLIQLGQGTQKVEDILASRFPDARIRRVDSDTMKHREHYRRIVDDFEARKIDVMVGTQMIAKGLDFPFVSFVGVIDADPTGISADFRAEERLFQIITQVAGRAGRADVPGRVVVQTTMPEIPAFKYAMAHDFKSFAVGELAARKRVGLPPFRRIARIVLTHAREEDTRREAEAVAVRVRDVIGLLALDHADVLGPAPCMLSRLRGKYRYELLLRTLTATDMRALTNRLEESKALQTKAAALLIDVGPVSLA